MTYEAWNTGRLPDGSRIVSTPDTVASPPTIPADVGRRAMKALKATADALEFLRQNGIYVWPNHPANPEKNARAAITELKQYLGEKK
jgi:hypothetical protein